MQFGDKLKGPSRVGSTGLGVKQKGQTYTLVGGGLMGTKLKWNGPLSCPQTTTKVWW